MYTEGALGEQASYEEPVTWDIREGFVDEVWSEAHLKRQVKCLQSRSVYVGQGSGRATQLSRERQAVWGSML